METQNMVLNEGNDDFNLMTMKWWLMMTDDGDKW